jgi:hypothetical protein
LVTGNTSAAIGAAADAVAGGQRVCKPVDVDELLAIIKRLLDAG